MNNAQKCQPGQEQDFAVSACESAAYMILTHLVKFMECSANVKQVTRIEKHWFVVERVG